MRYELTAKRLKEAMNDLHMTQQELADKSKIGKSSISHYVNGSNEPGNKSAYAMAKVLNVNPAWLMGLDERKIISLDYDIDDLCIDMEKDEKAFEELSKRVLNFKVDNLDKSKELKKALDLYERYSALDEDEKSMIDMMLKKFKKSE